MSSRRTIDPGAIMQRIGDAVALDYAGNREGARARLAALWDEMHPDGDALHRCMIAHYMADMQADPRQERCGIDARSKPLSQTRGLGRRARAPGPSHGIRPRTAGEWLRQYDPPRYRLPGRSA
jgi:hypothetical protein